MACEKEPLLQNSSQETIEKKTNSLFDRIKKANGVDIPNITDHIDVVLRNFEVSSNSFRSGGLPFKLLGYDVTKSNKITIDSSGITTFSFLALTDKEKDNFFRNIVVTTDREGTILETYLNEYEFSIDPVDRLMMISKIKKYNLKDKKDKTNNRSYDPCDIICVNGNLTPVGSLSIYGGGTYNPYSVRGSYPTYSGWYGQTGYGIFGGSTYGGWGSHGGQSSVGSGVGSYDDIFTSDRGFIP